MRRFSSRGSKWGPSVEALVMGTALALCLSGCDATGPEAGRVRLIQAMRRWNAADLTSYTYRVTRSCECLRESSGQREVRVVGGVVESVIWPESLTPVGPEYVHLFPSVKGLFEIIDEAIRDETDRLKVHYDPTTGTPLRIEIGHPEVDAGVTYTSTVPEPLPSG